VVLKVGVAALGLGRGGCGSAGLWPLALHCLVEALDVAVSARCGGRRDDLTDLVLGEQLVRDRLRV
jgi:hypothetical protein